MMKITLKYLSGVIFVLILMQSCNNKESAFFSNHYPSGYSAMKKQSSQLSNEKVNNDLAEANKEILTAVGEAVIFKSDIAKGININKKEERIKATLTEEKKANAVKEVAVSKKEVKKILKQTFKEGKSNDSSISKLLLVIIAILIPPLAVALVDGIHGPFWLSILLTILFYLPGLIYAIYRIYKND